MNHRPFRIHGPWDGPEPLLGDLIIQAEAELPDPLDGLPDLDGWPFVILEDDSDELA